MTEAYEQREFAKRFQVHMLHQNPKLVLFTALATSLCVHRKSTYEHLGCKGGGEDFCFPVSHEGSEHQC